MESLVGNLKTGKMIRSNVLLATGLVVVLEKDAQRGGEVAKQINKLKLKKKPTLKWDSNMSLECKQEKKVFKMHPANMKKVLLLNIGTVPSFGDLTPKAWYSINLSNIRCEGDNWVVGTMGSNIKKMPPNSPFPRMCVSLESVIYIIGNDVGVPSSTRIFYLDMSNPENEWLEGPSLNLCRNKGSAVVPDMNDKKIYVFGGFDEVPYKKHCFGEVYDPVLNSWEPLVDPPEKLARWQSNIIGSYEGKKFLVHPCWDETLYAYDVLDKSWEVLDGNFIGGESQGVIMDNVLYVYDDWNVEIRGYDLARSIWLGRINLDSPKWFPKTRQSRGMNVYEGFFFEVGENVLCLLHFDRKSREGLVIYCKTFTIKKTMQEGGNVLLETEVYSSTIYNLGEMGECLNYVVM